MDIQSQTNTWDSIYKQGAKEEEPREEVIPLQDLFQKNKVQKILDLGCGGGRHLVYFAKLGYRVSGIDVAPEAIKLSQRWLAREGLRAELQCADMIRLPWPDKFFDAVLSIRVLEHSQLKHIQKILKEVYRVIRDNGYFFANLKKHPPWKGWKEGKFTRIDHHLYAPTEGPEKGIIHYFFTEDELKEILSDFSIIKLEEDSKQRHYCVLAKKNT
jgi:ubiquinone/menaquinone biosynthesis C-methylase UbiE